MQRRLSNIRIEFFRHTLLERVYRSATILAITAAQILTDVVECIVFKL